MAKFFRIPVIEQYNSEADVWNKLIELDPIQVRNGEENTGELLSKHVKEILQSILSSDVFYIVRESDGNAVMSMHSHGAVRITMKSKLEKTPPAEKAKS